MRYGHKISPATEEFANRQDEKDPTDYILI